MIIDRRMAIAGLGAAGTALAAPAAGAASAPRVPRQVLAFYYGWYANPATSGRWAHWQGPTGREEPRQSPTFHHPQLGMYDSHDPEVLRHHARWARQAGLTGMISSWWGRDSFEDRTTALLLDAMHDQGLKVTVYLESQKGGIAGAEADFRYLLARYADHPAWLKVDGRPVFFIYMQGLEDLAAGGWRKAARAAAAGGSPEPILIGDVSPREDYYTVRAAPMDGTHVYVMAPYITGMTPAQIEAYTDTAYRVWKRKAGGKIYCATVIPGFDDTRVPGRPLPRPVVGRRGGDVQKSLWRAAIKTGANWVLVTSFNEWHEGSEIEPSVENGTAALSLNRSYALQFLNSRV